VKKSSRVKQIGKKEGRRSRQSPITIVDDDESVRAAIESLLKAMGFRAEVFASAKDFLNSAQLNHTACLILDVRMPGMDGLELQRQLAAADCRIPIVFITAHDDEDVRKRALQAGAVDFLSKPFSEEALLSAVRSALECAADSA